MKNYETINEEVFEMNMAKEDNFNNSEVLYYLEEMISMGAEENYESEAYQDIKQHGKVKSSSLKKIKRNMFKLYNEKF
ncbi:hypothetical protein FJQ98_16610 [Lysinibacillus agricola]|uniref:Uncharacterized protein n=1 Tax=Lysinibacillus agricola TaxID=2590012 RepID=A0ABX7ALS5_9BACI|nr:MULTISPECIES: hypothetical protein [Lysinibacillus]KOS61450.1 hypothetical protein AN161_17825 [Lysinibacillus sp. FJAT-14222]QQP10868.1 hypothetical protein FJQ98_16610 [Lysinibacillus agricola]